MNPELPTIVLVVFDTARWDRFGCYGYERATTPTVDSLARDGLRLRTVVSNAPWTLPSHGSLFTGLYPSEHGAQWGTGPRLRDAVEVTMVEWMRGLGYETVCATSNGLISGRTGLARGFDRYAYRLDLERKRRRYTRPVRRALSGVDSGGPMLNRWLGQELPKVSRPLFLFVNYMECHWGWAPPLVFERRMRGDRLRFPERIRHRVGSASRMGPWEAIARADDRMLRVYSALYDGELATADHYLDELLDILDRTGHLERGRTLLILTSDHGEHIGEHGLADHHGSLDDHLVRVPFVVWGPDLVRRGDDEELYEFVDVFPSLIDLLDRELPVPYLEGRRTNIFNSASRRSGEEYAFAEWRSWSEDELARLASRNPSYDFSGLRRDLVSVRDSRYKLVRGGDGTERLYDLEDDPAEETDISSSSHETARRLRKKLDARRQSWRSWDGEATELTERERLEIEEHLAHLGYI